MSAIVTPGNGRCQHRSRSNNRFGYLLAIIWRPRSNQVAFGEKRSQLAGRRGWSGRRLRGRSLRAQKPERVPIVGFFGAGALRPLSEKLVAGGNLY